MEPYLLPNQKHNYSDLLEIDNILSRPYSLTAPPPPPFFTTFFLFFLISSFGKRRERLQLYPYHHEALNPSSSWLQTRTRQKCSFFSNFFVVLFSFTIPEFLIQKRRKTAVLTRHIFWCFNFFYTFAHCVYKMSLQVTNTGRHTHI